MWPTGFMLISFHISQEWVLVLWAIHWRSYPYPGFSDTELILHTGMLSLSFSFSFLQMYTLIHTDEVSFEMPFGEQMGFQLQPNQTNWGTGDSGQSSDRSKGLGVKKSYSIIFHPQRTLSRRCRYRGEEGCWGYDETYPFIQIDCLNLAGKGDEGSGERQKVQEIKLH